MARGIAVGALAALLLFLAWVKVDAIAASHPAVAGRPAPVQWLSGLGSCRNWLPDIARWLADGSAASCGAA